MINVQSTKIRIWDITKRDIAFDLLYTDTKNEAEVMISGMMKAMPNALVFNDWSLIAKVLAKSQNEKVNTIISSN